MFDDGPLPTTMSSRLKTFSATSASRVRFRQKGPCTPIVLVGPPMAWSRMSMTR